MSDQPTDNNNPDLDAMLANLGIEQGPEPLQLPGATWLQHPVVQTLLHHQS